VTPVNNLTVNHHQGIAIFLGCFLGCFLDRPFAIPHYLLSNSFKELRLQSPAVK
jgi:hypothetical protein